MGYRARDASGRRPRRPPVNEGARRIVLNTSYRTIPDVAGKVATFLLYVVMAREVDPSEFGVFTFSLAYVGIVTVLGSFGQDWILTREVARERGAIDRYFANTLLLKVGLSIPALGLSLAVLAVVSSPHTTFVSLLLGLSAVAELLTQTCFAVFQAYERLALVSAVLVPQRLLTALAGIALLLAGQGIVAVAVVFLIGSALGLAASAALMFGRVVRAALALDPSIWRPLMRAAIPVGVATVASLVLFRIDTAMLAAYKSSKVVGTYGASYRLLEASLFISWGLGAAVFPVFSRLHASSEPRVGVVFERSLKLLTALTLPLAAGAGILAAPLIDLIYGRHYDSGVTALRLLAPAIALYPAAYIAGDLLVSQMRQNAVSAVYVVVVIQNILLNLFLIPRWSLNGAAAGTSISQVLATGALVYLSLRTVGRLDWRRMLAGPVVASVVAGVAMATLQGSIVAALAAAAVLYAASLVVFERFAFPDDARVLFDLARRA
ncbi:MAG TPA: flippase [Gaiellaceae bacterium]|nr:flippase [Gaiellaceae bacterium]